MLWSLIAVSYYFETVAKAVNQDWLQLSLSNCQVQIIGSSLKSCTELKELRLADNDIKVNHVRSGHFMIAGYPQIHYIFFCLLIS